MTQTTRIPSVFDCPLCGLYGRLEFAKDAGGRTLFQCNECFSCYVSPGDTGETRNMLPGMAELLTPATMQDIVQAGWTAHVLKGGAE